MIIICSIRALVDCNFIQIHVVFEQGILNLYAHPVRVLEKETV